MTEIFGVLNPGQRPLTPGELEPVRQFFAYHYPPATIQCWQQGPVALGSRLQSGNEAPPAAWPTIRHCGDGDLAIAASVRLDNRAELATSLTLPANVRAGISDEELILLAYQKWGRQCPAHLLGDFAFVIWDGPGRRLFCARDHMGIKPFYFSFHNSVFVFASDVQGVLASRRVPRDLSDLGIARYLLEGDLNDERLTFYDAVRKLPPATTLIVEATGLSETRYWQAEATPTIRYRNVEDYTERLRELLERSVKARLPAKGPVGAHLSGGLDSSGLTGIAADLLGEDSHRLKTWSWMRPPASEREWKLPEWSMGQSVADHLGLEHHFIEFDVDSILARFEDSLLQRHDTMDMWYEYAVRDQAGAAGIRVMLSGWGGDQLITHYGHQRYAETFRPGALASTLNAVLDESRRAPKTLRRFLGLFYSHILRPHTTPNYWAETSSPHLDALCLACTTDEFRSRMNSLPPSRPQNVDTVRADQLNHIRRYLLQTRLDSWAASGARAGIDYCYPLLDQRIVEFALGIPPDLYRMHGHSRFIYRSAISRYLPDDAAWKNLKGEPRRIQTLFDITIRACKQWIGSAEETKNPYISLARLKSQVDRLPGEGSAGSVSIEAICRLMTITKAILLLKL